MTLRLIPAGEFIMGSPDDAFEADKTRNLLHRVRISKPFYLGVSEVTQAEYEALMGNNPSHCSANGGGKDRVAGLSTDSVSGGEHFLVGRDRFLQQAEREGR